MIKYVKRGVKKVYAGFALLSLEILVMVFAMTTFVWLARMIFIKKDEQLDAMVFSFLTPYVSDSNTGVMQFFTFLGTHNFLIPANLILIAWFIIKKNRWYSIKVPAVALTSLLWMVILKNIFQRSRPDSPLIDPAMGYSFPSGHATMSTTFYGLLIYLVWKNVANIIWRWVLTILLALLIIFIGLSRVYLRVHNSSDVLAGFCVGLLWLLLSLWILGRIEKFSRKKVDPLVQTQVTVSTPLEVPLNNE